MDLCCCLGSHFHLPASAQGPAGHVDLFQDPLPATDQRTAGPVLSFLDPLPSACHFSENHRSCAFVSGYTACLCSWTCRTVVSSRHPLPSTCYCSESHRTCGVVMGPTGTCLPLLWNPQDLCCGLENSVSCQSLLIDPQDLSCASRPTSPCLPLLRVLQDMQCRLGIPSCLPAAAQGGTGPLVLSRDPLPHDCNYSRTSRTCAVVSRPTAACSGNFMTCVGVS